MHCFDFRTQNFNFCYCAVVCIHLLHPNLLRKYLGNVLFHRPKCLENFLAHRPKYLGNVLFYRPIARSSAGPFLPRTFLNHFGLTGTLPRFLFNTIIGVVRNLYLHIILLFFLYKTLNNLVILI